MTPKQRDIVLVPLPFTDLTSVKRRPVLVLSNDSHNRRGQDVVVSAITSRFARGPTRFASEQQTWTRGNYSATVLCGRIKSIP